MNQFEINLQNVINQLPQIVAEAVLTVGLDAKALMQQRVQEKGLNASGGKTPNYSTPYAERRKKKGLQTSYMDATFTGEMWRSIGHKATKTEGDKVTVTIAGRDELTQAKIDSISTKHFELLRMSKEEEELAQVLFDKDLGTRLIEGLSYNT
jgi:hypothetical protein